jgi:integrase
MGLGRLFLRNSVWWFAIGLGGRKYRFSTKLRGGVEGKPPREVELWRARKLAELGQTGAAGLRAEVVTVGDILDMLWVRYEAEGRTQSLRTGKARVEKLRSGLGTWKALELKADRILEWAVSRRKSGAAIATVNLELALLARAFRVAQDSGRIVTAPKVPRLPGANVRRSHVPDAILDKIREKLPKWAADAVWFLRLTGWRLEEGLGLEWRRVDFAEQCVRLDTSKTGEPRVLSFRNYADLRGLLEERWYAGGLARSTRAGDAPVGDGSVPSATHGISAASDELPQALRRMERITPYVFTGPRGGRMSSRTLRGLWNAAAASAGLPGAILHDLRRSMVRAMDRAGVPRSVAMSITGHKSEAVYRQYGLFDSAMQDVALASLTPDLTVAPIKKAT